MGASAMWMEQVVRNWLTWEMTGSALQLGAVNFVRFVPGVVAGLLAGVLADLSMTSTLDTSLKLGKQVLRNVDDIARLHKKQVEQAGFAVLKSPDVPSILVETGFISNPKESSLLATSRYQKKMASAIHRGIKGWFSAHPPSGTLLAWQKQQGGQQYIIARGDTLSGIADRFSISLADLKSYNRIDSSKILVGQKLNIPKS